MIHKEFTSKELFKLREIADEEVEDMFGDAEEIGSSDISICVRQILDTAQGCGIEVDHSLGSIRGLISDALCEMEGV